MSAPGGQGPAPISVLVLTGGLIHLVHQLAVVRELPELDPVRASSAGPHPPRIGVVITGVISRDPLAMEGLRRSMEAWFSLLRRREPGVYGAIRVLREDTLRPGEWDLACVNNAWQESQHALVRRLAIASLVVAGDGLGVYYRHNRELRAIGPSLLGKPIPELKGLQVRYALSGRQPRWHRPPTASLPEPLVGRAELFQQLVASLAEGARPLVAACLRAADGRRPLWLCSVPNLAHQFPGRQIPHQVLGQWRSRLEGFDPALDRWLLIDHPKAPPEGSVASPAPSWIAGPLRSAVPLEVLVALVERAAPDRSIVVAGLTSALCGVQALTGARVVWLSSLPLWRCNPNYRRRPLEFLHRLVRARRMARLLNP